MLIGELSTKCARRDADKTAIVFDDVRINFSEFNNRVNQCAAFLISKGLSKGDKIAILSRNHPVMLEVLFAAAKCGIVYVPINFRLASVEVNFVIRDSGAKLFLVSDVFNVTIDPDLPVVPLSLEKDYENCIKNKPVSEPCVDVKTQDPFAIFYTSGTTGDPKGVVLSHENFISNIVNEIISYGIRPDDICLHTLPLYHTAEASFALAQFYIGGTCVVLETYNADSFWQIVDAEGITHTSMVFTMLLPLLDEYEKLGRENTGTLRTLALGGQTTPIEIIRRAVRLLGTDIMMIVYGLTESSPYLTYLSKKDLAENGGYSRKISSVGKEMFSCSVRVVGEDGREIEAGGIGEVIGKGPNVMMGYYNREEENKSVLRDGWLYTGDVATMDEEGFIYIVDRKKDLIISGGENISPREVEDVIYRHPAVSECSVIGVADAKWGEHVLAVVVNKPGVELREETLIEFCRQDLAGYKIPRSVVFVEALPKDPVGKIQKKILRDWYA